MAWFPNNQPLTNSLRIQLETEKPADLSMILRGSYVVTCSFNENYNAKISDLLLLNESFESLFHIFLRIQACPKKGIGPPPFLLFSDGIGTLNPIRSGWVGILRNLD